MVAEVISIQFIIGRGGGGISAFCYSYYPLNILNNFSDSNLIPIFFFISYLFAFLFSIMF
jgi:hypothetical protein